MNKKSMPQMMGDTGRPTLTLRCGGLGTVAVAI